MAISPFKFGAKKGARKNGAATQLPPLSKRDRLNFSQALTITAGLAGLVGLCSGIVIRFSLANSDSARFLSPLQTFPTLSSWTPESASVSPNDTENSAGDQRASEQAMRDSENGDALENSVRAEERLDIDSRPTEDSWAENSTSDSAINVRTFDSFANRTDEETSNGSPDPWRRLEEGPQFERSVNESDRLNEGSASSLDRSDSDPTPSYYENAYDEPEDESGYSDSPGDNYYDGGTAGDTPDDDSFYNGSSYDDGSYGDGSYDDSSYDDSSYDDGYYSEESYDYE